jgi:hypothetical protein
MISIWNAKGAYDEHLLGLLREAYTEAHNKHR